MNKSSKVKVKVVDVGRSGRPEYTYFDYQEYSKFKPTVVQILRSNLMPTTDDLVKNVLEASLACQYWRQNLSFEQAVEEVIQDIKRAVERG